jgi:hypothetical protein
MASRPAAAPPAAPVEHYDPFKPGLPPSPPGSGGSGFVGKFFRFLGNLCFFGFIFLVIACFVLIQIGKSAQRRNRR